MNQRPARCSCLWWCFVLRSHKYTHVSVSGERAWTLNNSLLNTHTSVYSGWAHGLVCIWRFSMNRRGDAGKRKTTISKSIDHLMLLNADVVSEQRAQWRKKRNKTKNNVVVRLCSLIPSKEHWANDVRIIGMHRFSIASVWIWFGLGRNESRCHRRRRHHYIIIISF